jgi:endonuclease/exonuclease/phosphatase family metal-dependent hydrolase
MRARSRLELGPVLLSCAFFSLGCEPFADPFDFDREEVPVFERSELLAPADSRPSELRVMAYNIKFGAARTDYWFDYWGDEVQLDHEEVHSNMSKIYRLVREYDPDILIAEEIEVNSQRSAYYDMVQGMMENTRLNYAAYIQTWDSRYVASEGMGRLDMGNAIFSKYPITFAERIRQPDRTDLSGLVVTFYLHRMIGHAVVDIGGGRAVSVFGVHTEAYDKDGTKQRQIDQIYEEASAAQLPFLLGGDFNELPPTALKLEDFPDEEPSTQGTEYEQPPYTPEIMQKFYDDMEPWVTLEEYGATEEAQRRYFSHSVLGPDSTDNNGDPGFWNRTLDYLFLSKGQSWKASSCDVLQEPGRLAIESNPLLLSDHAPVAGTWLVGEAP